MQLEPQQLTKVLHRLRRAEGQLGAVVRMVEEGRDCEDVVTQLSAVSHAIDRAGFVLIATGIRQCMIAEAASEDGESQEAAARDVAVLERLFLSLA